MTLVGTRSVLVAIAIGGALLGVGCAGRGEVAGRARTTVVRQHAQGGEIALHGSVVRAWPEAEMAIAEHCGGPARLVERAELERVVLASASGDEHGAAKLGAPAASAVGGERVYYVCRAALGPQ